MKYAKVFFCQIYKVIQEKATNGCTSPVCRSNLPALMLDLSQQNGREGEQLLIKSRWRTPVIIHICYA